MQQFAQIAHWAKHLDAGHQEDKQRFQAHLALRHPPRAQAEGRRAAPGHAEIRDAARCRAGCQDLHGGVRQRTRLLGQSIALRGTLTKGLQRREPLKGVEKFGRVGAHHPALIEASLLLALMKRRRQDQGCRRESEQNQRHGPVQQQCTHEQEQGGEGGDNQLRHITAEKHLQLIDSIHQRRGHIPRPRSADIGWPQGGQVIE